MRTAIALVKDFELYSALQVELRQFGVSLKSVTTSQAAFEEIKQHEASLMIVDLRECHEDNEEAKLLKQIASTEFPAINVISIVQKSLPLHCAADAELVSASFIVFPQQSRVQNLTRGTARGDH